MKLRASSLTRGARAGNAARTRIDSLQIGEYKASPAMRSTTRGKSPRKILRKVITSFLATCLLVVILLAIALFCLEVTSHDRFEASHRRIVFIRALTLKNRLPSEVENALHNSGRATLYSIRDPEEIETAPATAVPSDHVSLNLTVNPANLQIPVPRVSQETLQGGVILGHVELSQAQLEKAVHEIESAAFYWNGGIKQVFRCHLGLRVVWQAHTYDLLLGYEGREIRIYRKDKGFIGSLPATGSGKDLDEILTSAGVPLEYKVYRYD